MKSITEKLNILRDKVKFLRTILFGLLSAVGGFIFAFSQNKLLLNLKFSIVIILTIVSVFYIIFKIKQEEKKINFLIRKLERLKNG